MKKFIVFVLAFACMLFLIACGNGADAPENPTTKDDALMEAAQIYLTTEAESKSADCVIGSRLSVYRLEAGKPETIDYEKYPVFVGNRVVAFVTCTLGKGGEYITGCGATFAESFWQEYAKQPDVAFAIVYAQEGVYLVREGEVPVLLHEMPTEGCAPIAELENCRSSLLYSLM